ncbi:MAG: hypothetical protein R3C58_04275 [Parvularculaceae bacterium]
MVRQLGVYSVYGSDQIDHMAKELRLIISPYNVVFATMTASWRRLRWCFPTSIT